MAGLVLLLISLAKFGILFDFLFLILRYLKSEMD